MNLKIVWAPHLPVAKSSNDGLLSQEKLSQRCKTRRQIDPEPLQSRVKLQHKQLAMVSLFRITNILTVAVSSACQSPIVDNSSPNISSQSSSSSSSHSPSKSPSPIPLPDIPVFLEWNVNNRALPGSKQRVIKLEDDYQGFLFELHRLCTPKLNGKRWSDRAVKITYEWAWMLSSKIQAKTMAVKYSGLEDEEDFQAIKHTVRKTKNSRDMTLKILALIVIESDDPNEDSTASVPTSGRSVRVSI